MTHHRDEYGRRVSCDEYGAFVIPNVDSTRYALEEQSRLRAAMWKNTEEARKVDEKKERIQGRKDTLFKKRFRGSIADGRDMNHHAPGLQRDLRGLQEHSDELEADFAALLSEWLKLRETHCAELYSEEEGR